MTVIKISKGHDFDRIRDRAKERLDLKASIQRAKFLTASPGQDYVYAQKLREAQEFLSSDMTDTSAYPFLEQEASARGVSCKAIAQVVVSKRDETNRRLARIEHVRFTTRALIDAAPDKIAIIEQIVDEADFMDYLNV